MTGTRRSKRNLDKKTGLSTEDGIDETGGHDRDDPDDIAPENQSKKQRRSRSKASKTSGNPEPEVQKGLGKPKSSKRKAKRASERCNEEKTLPDRVDDDAGDLEVKLEKENESQKSGSRERKLRKRSVRAEVGKKEEEDDYDNADENYAPDREDEEFESPKKKPRRRAPTNRSDSQSSGRNDERRTSKIKKTFTKPFVPKVDKRSTPILDADGFSNYERRVIELMKSLEKESSEDSESIDEDSSARKDGDGGGETAQENPDRITQNKGDTLKRSPEGGKGNVKVEKKMEIMALLKKHEDVQTMDTGDSDDEDVKVEVKAEKKSESSDEEDWQVVDSDYKRPEKVTVVLQNEDLIPESRRLTAQQMMARTINRKRKKIGLLQHRGHLLALIYYQQYLHSFLQDPELRALALSVTPDSNRKNRLLTTTSLSVLLQSIADEYGSNVGAESREAFVPELLKERLSKFFREKESACNIVLLLGSTLLLRAAGYRCRLCLSHQILTHKMPLLRAVDGDLVQVKPKIPSVPRGVSDYFVEVHLPDERSWRPLDLESFSVIQDVKDLTPLLEQPALYILGIDIDGKFTDLSPKYNPEWLNRVQKLRSDSAFLQDVLSRFKPDDEQDAVESKEIEELHEEEGLPKQIGGFKNHPKYVLRRHLLKFEALYPEEPPIVGYIRKEPVYPRECVHTLRSKDTWHRFGRQVREGENAYNIVKARPKWDKKTETLVKDLPLEVYGEWQTDPYVPPVVVDGKIPRNQYGNVELFTENMLPIGAVHLKLAGLQKVADELGVDCVPAVVGFEGVHRGLHPVIEGFVVCKEHKQLLEDAWTERRNEDHRKRRERIVKRAKKNWKRLIKKVLVDIRFKKKYKQKLK